MASIGILRRFTSSINTKQVPYVGIICISKRDNSNIAAFKKGKGGRSSFSGHVVTVLGAGGFVGTSVVNQLGKCGSQIICPYRGEPYYYRNLKLAGDLGQVLFFAYDLRDEESLRKVMKYSTAVVNLVGKEWETKNFKFKDVNVDGARRIARIAKESGVDKLIHFSHLNAQPNPPSFFKKGGSEFLKSKWEGEQAVLEEFPEAVIFRPADIYGPGDRFMNYYGNKWRKTFKTLPLYARGTKTIKRPVYVGDVAKGVVAALNDKDSYGNIYEIVGPKGYLLSDLLDYMHQCMRWSFFYRTWITPPFLAKAWAFNQFPSRPPIWLDKLEFEHVNDILHEEFPQLSDLGVKLTRIEDRAMWELKPYRRYNYMEDIVGEWPDPIPPKSFA